MIMHRALKSAFAGLTLACGLGFAHTALAQSQPPATQLPPAVQPQPSAPQATTPAPSVKGERAGRGSMRVCQADVAALCPSVPARGGGRFKCLKDNQAKLSPVCGQVVSERLARQAQRREVRKSDNQAGRAACRADGRKFCKGERGKARTQCLIENKAAITPACAQWAEQRAAQGAKRQPSPPKQ